MTNSINFNVIGHVKSPYKEKFAIPRQPGLASAAKGQVILTGSANNSELVRGLEQFSHIWLLFVFHGTQEQGWKPLVRPPRLGGNKKMGVLATRSTFRPNPIGMSVVKLDNIECENNQVILNISALDLLDATPIVDIKPYIPYADIIDNANAGYADLSPQQTMIVSFTENAEKHLALLKKDYFNLELLITQVLTQDPRPAYKQGKTDEKIYAMSLYDLNISWRMNDLVSLTVTSVTKI
jgi:tRNA-Thr(GGU) m(6)t(6)A37 methyltransferase TsaA